MLFIRFLIGLILIVSGVPAHADTFQFDFSGVTGVYQGILRNDTFSFKFDTSALNNGTLDTSTGIITYLTPAIVNGTYVPDLWLSENFTTISRDPITTLYVAERGNNYYYISYSQFLFGDLNAPVVKAGTYGLVGWNYSLGYPASGYLTITNLTPAPAVAPEPSTLILLSTGLFGIAGLMRKQLPLFQITR